MRFNPLAVWTLIPVANRLVEVNTKTGFSLTAGSYLTHVTNNQRGTVTHTNGVITNTASISSVTATRTSLTKSGNDSTADTAAASAVGAMMARFDLTSATVVTMTRGVGTGSAATGTYQGEETV